MKKKFVIEDSVHLVHKDSKGNIISAAGQMAGKSHIRKGVSNGRKRKGR